MSIFSKKLSHNLLDEAVFELDLGDESNEEVAEIMTALANHYYEKATVSKTIGKELTAMFSQYDVPNATVKKMVREELDKAYREGSYSEMGLYYFLLMLLTFKNVHKPIAQLSKYKGKMFTLQLFMKSLGYTTFKSGKGATAYYMIAQLMPTLAELRLLCKGLDGFFSIYGVPSEFKMTATQMIVAEEVIQALPDEYQHPIHDLLFEKAENKPDEKPDSTEQKAD